LIPICSTILESGWIWISTTVWGPILRVFNEILNMQ